ncbi:MAG: sulfotransferase family protein, partial [Phycisphaerales bacterium]
MPEPVFVVSGLPRSGTSLAMQMLHAGGIPAVTDGLRTQDDDNPRGYFEFERVKQLRTDKAWLDDAAGKAVKVIHLLLMELPDDRPYRVVFMQRDLREVVKSQS